MKGGDQGQFGNASMNHRYADRLLDGIAAWNSWREEHPAIEIDLSGVMTDGKKRLAKTPLYFVLNNDCGGANKNQHCKR
jgi:hypothetical protein